MTDEDRFGRKLGRGFKSVRALAGLPDGELDFADKCARYTAKMVLKEADIAKLIGVAAAVLNGSQALFAASDPFEYLRRASVDSVPADHFFQSLLETQRCGRDVDQLLECFARRCAQSTQHLAALQSDLKDDRDLQRALSNTAPQTESRLSALFRASCGLQETPKMETRKDQASLIEFVVVRQ